MKSPIERTPTNDKIMLVINRPSCSENNLDEPKSTADYWRCDCLNKTFFILRDGYECTSCGMSVENE